LAASLRAAVAQLTRRPDGLVLIGIEPDEADPELGYIVPGMTGHDGALTVRQFVEKPSAAVARELIAAGAVWNSFIFAAHGPALLGVIRERMPSIVEDMATALALDARRGGEPVALEQLYDDLPSVDFSKAIMQRAADRLSDASGTGLAAADTPAQTRPPGDADPVRIHQPRDATRAALNGCLKGPCHEKPIDRTPALVVGQRAGRVHGRPAQPDARRCPTRRSRGGRLCQG
jgi:hypothetical protein